jgi:peptidoglycan LD-endopeptidase LytH
MIRSRRYRRLFRQETLAPWVAMAVILGGWSLVAKFVAPVVPRAALAGPSRTEIATGEPSREPDAAPAQASSPNTVAPRSSHAADAPVLAFAPQGTSGTLSEPAADVNEDVTVLRTRDLAVPVSGVERRVLTPTFGDPRGGGKRVHEALDIMASRGTPVVAADSGTIVKLFQSKPGGTTIYQFDPSGSYCYYYAHLDRYAEGLAQGNAVERGQTIGYVGSTGNASPDAPHLHFAIFRLGPEKHWWEGVAIDPYVVLH